MSLVYLMLISVAYTYYPPKYLYFGEFIAQLLVISMFCILDLVWIIKRLEKE